MHTSKESVSLQSLKESFDCHFVHNRMSYEDAPMYINCFKLCQEADYYYIIRIKDLFRYKDWRNHFL